MSNPFAENTVQFPRFTQSFIRRLNVAMGGMQVGLGSLLINSIATAAYSGMPSIQLRQHTEEPNQSQMTVNLYLLSSLASWHSSHVTDSRACLFRMTLLTEHRFNMALSNVWSFSTVSTFL